MLADYELPCNAPCNTRKKEVNSKQLFEYDCNVFDDQLMLCHVYKVPISKNKTQKTEKNLKIKQNVLNF